MAMSKISNGWSPKLKSSKVAIFYRKATSTNSQVPTESRQELLR